MTVAEILTELQTMSNANTMTHNLKYGAGKHQFGVKLGDIRKLAARIKINHHLGLQLWHTKNIDARLLACLVMEPASLSAEEVDAQVQSIDFVQVADWFNAHVLKDHPEKEKLRERFMHSDNPWAARSGWSLTAAKIAKGASGLDLSKLLDHIMKEMPGAPSEVQWTMNTALAYIGIHHPTYRQQAIDIGHRLGIYRDYPVSKGCTSPFAPIWISEMVSRQTGKK